MSSAIRADDLSALANMLDPELARSLQAGGGIERPQSQSVGFSLAQAPSNRPGAAPEDATAAPGPSTGHAVMPMMHPAAAALPAAQRHRQEAQQLGLPVPSATREGRAAMEAAERAGGPIKRATGKDIWTAEEVDTAFGYAPSDAAAVTAARSSHTKQTPATTVASTAMSASAPPVAAAVAKGAVSSSASAAFEEPVHTVRYQHVVRAEDTYLGMDFTRDTSIRSAEGLVVTVELPRVAAAKDIELDVRAFELSLRAPPQYLLKAALPLQVVEHQADAKWDSKRRVLTVKLTADPAANKMLVV